MGKRRRLVVLVPAMALLATGLPGSAAAEPPEPREHRGERSVTLLTGDRVVLDGQGAPREIRRGPGREQKAFSIQQRGASHHVIPEDAQPLLASGRLDPRLFDINALVAFGYTDDKRAELPLILAYRDAGARSGARRAPGRTGMTARSELSSVDGVAADLVKREATAAWSALSGGPGLGSGLTKVWLNGKRKPLLDRSTAQVGAPAAWQAGLTGKGVKVAVLDTGVDAAHPDLAGRVAAAKNFTGEDARDVVGHGTHVAATVGGHGQKYRGVAPEATLLDGKVCEADGCTEDAILRGMEWATAEQRAKVVNLSVGGDDSPGLDPVEQAVNTLTERHGTLFVAASGNSQGRCAVNSPASADAALAVGAVDREDQLADFSCVGPRVGDGGLKPDLTAPGVEIVAARSQHSQEGEPGQQHIAMSGTSMATPHVAGAAAVLAGQHPDWSPARLKATLMASARPNPARTVFEQGAGRLDLAAAISAAVTTEPLALNLGVQRYPHGDDEPVVRTVAYRNAGATPVTLTPRFEVHGPGGAQPPAGMFTVAPATVTVPAGGTAQVTITADTRTGGPNGSYSGRLVTRAGAADVQTPFVLEQEEETYDLTVVHKDRAGNNTAAHQTYAVFLTHNDYREVTGAGGVATVRLPKGDYHLDSMINSAAAGAPRDAAILAQPLVRLDKDTTVVFEAATTKPIRVSVPARTARLIQAEVSGMRKTAAWPWRTTWTGPDFTGLHTGGTGPDVPEYDTDVHAEWAEPDAQGKVDRSPYLYSLTWQHTGRMRTGFSHEAKHAELARFDAGYRATDTGQVGQRLAWDVPASGRHTYGPRLIFPLPHKRVEYRSPDIGTIDYFDVATDLDPAGYPQYSLQTPVLPPPGRTHRSTTWGGGPFGLSYASGEGITRQGNQLKTNVLVHNDRDDHLGSVFTKKAKVALHRDGKLIKEDSTVRRSAFTLPATPGTYRLDSEESGIGMAGLSSTLLSSWTFRSQHEPGAEPAKLPLHVLRFSPELDEYNRAPAGRDFLIPIHAENQPGAPSRTIRKITAEVSYDDGATWTAAEPVVAHGPHALVKVRHPRGEGFVSLRAKAVDHTGDSVEQTVIRAYRLG